jgi:pimeloyl-ACP methyl ester carboxylesterase
LNAYAYKAPDGSTYESDGEFSRFTLSAYSHSWSRQPRIIKPGGLALDYYFNNDDSEVLTILIAFRGTEFTSVADWFSNLSWLTQLIPIKNQYDFAREAVSEIRTRAKALAKGKKLTMITTGHSLGGGLAEHIAYAFPCSSAVVFDSSFVVNRFRLAEPFADAQVVHIFDKNDELTFLRRLLFSDSESQIYKRYGINPVAHGGLQHRSEPLAVGMARMVAMCQSDPTRCNPPGCPKNDQRARRLYCESNYARREQQEPQCKF